MLDIGIPVNEKVKTKITSKAKAGLFIIVIISLLLGAGYIYITWKNSIQQEEDKAVDMAESARAFLMPDVIEKLKVSLKDIDKPEYINIKNSLKEFKISNNNIHTAYLLAQKNGEFYYMVDSELPGSTGYSPPGQKYSETINKTLYSIFQGNTKISRVNKSWWSRWVNVMIPIKDSVTGKVIAALSVDCSAGDWNLLVFNQSVNAAIEVACMLMLIIALYWISIKNVSLYVLSKKLKDSEELLRTVFVQAPLGIAVVEEDNQLSMINPMFEKILNRNKKELNSVSWVDLTYSGDVKADLEQFNKLMAGEINEYSLEKRVIMPDNSIVWIQIVNASLNLNSDNKRRYVCIIQDINEKKMAVEALLESERIKTVFLSNLPGMAYRCQYGKDWTMQFVSEGCYALTGYHPDTIINEKRISYREIIAPEYRDMLWHSKELMLPLQIACQNEYEIITANGERKWALEIWQGLYDESGNIEAIEGIVTDITEQKQKEKQIIYLNYHDYMTGLFNRKYYDDILAEMDREELLPLSIIIADINGVRLINNAYGYPEGDELIRETSKILLNCCRKGDVLARLGGDEFGLILPNTDSQTAHEITKAIENECNVYNENRKLKLYEITLSIGFATKEKKEDSIKETSKLADEFLQNRKLLNRNSSHSDIISSMMATVYEKSKQTEGHAKKLAALFAKIGEKMNLSQKSIGELELLAMLHDIGKVGIDDRVLNKAGELNDEEWVIMKKHPEIGFRIAKSTSELEPIAECILSHHERWDGLGYPKGLKGEEIPLFSRILAIADAYDAMTEDRVYRKAMTKEAAIEEIQKNAGSQFDPTIAQIFIDNI